MQYGQMYCMGFELGDDVVAAQNLTGVELHVGHKELLIPKGCEGHIVRFRTEYGVPCADIDFNHTRGLYMVPLQYLRRKA